MNAAGKTVWETVLGRPPTTAHTALPPFEETFPIDVRFVLRHSGDTPLPSNDSLQLRYVESGEALYEVQGRTIRVRQGDLLVLNANLFHRMLKCVQAEAREIVLDFQPELVNGDHPAGDNWLYLMPFLIQDEHFPHIVPAGTGIPAEVTDLVERIHRELPARTNRARLAVKTYVKMILVLLVNHYAPFAESSDAFRNKQHDLTRLKPLLDFVARNYREPITVRDGAAILHMSRPHFMRLFRSTMGETFVTYLNRLRIAKAEALLASTNKTVAEVGLEAGFKDQSYFGQVFRKMVHVTPRQYRSSLQQHH